MAFALRPDLDLVHELAQLGEHEMRVRALAVECFDPLEPGEDCARFFHVRDGTGARVSARAQLCNAFVAEQSRIELPQQ